MTVVHSRLIGPDGVPLANIAVTVELYARPPWTSDKTACVVGTATTRTDADGWWRFDIIPDAWLEGDPAYTYAKVIEFLPSGPLAHWLRVPDSPAPRLMRDLLVENPTAPPPWKPTPSIGLLGNVDPAADHPADGTTLIAAAGKWAPANMALASLIGIDGASLISANVGDPLVCLYKDGTGRTVWGVPTPPPDTLLYTLNRDPADDSGHTIALTIDARDDTKTVGVVWSTGTPEEIIPADVDRVTHHYEVAKTHYLVIRYTDGSESHDDVVSIPWKAAP